MISSKIEPYIKKQKEWMDVLKGKYLLFDTDAIISILSFKAETILSDFTDLNTTNCFIHPVYVELQGTDRAEDVFKRGKLIKDHKFVLLPLLKEEIECTNAVQTWLSSRGRRPSVTDLYLGGVLAKYSHKNREANIILLSGNVSDFIYPLFRREASIILQSEKQSKLIHCISLDVAELEKFSS